MSDIEINKEDDERNFFKTNPEEKITESNINNNNNSQSPNPYSKSQKNTLQSNEDMIDGATYYKNFIRDPGIEGRKASRVLFVRSFNNWIKAVLINKYSHLLGYDYSVLDLGCGRGGDLIKFFQTKVKLYVGADISEESLKNAMERLKKIKNEKYRDNFKIKCYFITEDLSERNNHLMEKINSVFRFDLVTCNFSLHYHFQSEERVRTFLVNVVSRLCDGGYFIGTIIDDNVIVKRLRNRKYNGNCYIDEKFKFGNEFYFCQFYQKRFNKNNGPYGIKYGFYLEDSLDKRDEIGQIKSVKEYLIIFEEFVKLCKEYDLYLVEKKNFLDFYQENLKTYQYEKLFYKMVNLNSSSISQQWEIVQLYRIFAFRKGKQFANSGNSNNNFKYVPFLSHTNIPFTNYEPELIQSSFK